MPWHVFPKKCNELILCKKVAHDIVPVNNIAQVSCLKVLGVTLQVPLCDKMFA